DRRERGIDDVAADGQGVSEPKYGGTRPALFAVVDQHVEVQKKEERREDIVLGVGAPAPIPERRAEHAGPKQGAGAIEADLSKYAKKQRNAGGAEQRIEDLQGRNGRQVDENRQRRMEAPADEAVKDVVSIEKI